MDKVTGGSLPAVIWRSVMAKALEGVPPRPLPGGGAEESAVASVIEDGAGFIGNLLERLRGATDGGDKKKSSSADGKNKNPAPRVQQRDK
jgi:penicillin-binding protein 1A